eukprot:scaffold4464_cov76-Amphora_coffeaeformis.AAC.1
MDTRVDVLDIPPSHRGPNLASYWTRATPRDVVASGDPNSTLASLPLTFAQLAFVIERQNKDSSVRQSRCLVVVDFLHSIPRHMDV